MDPKAIVYCRRLIKRGEEKLSEVNRLLKESEEVKIGYTRDGGPCLYFKGKNGEITKVTKGEILGAAEDLKVVAEGIANISDVERRLLERDTEKLSICTKQLQEYVENFCVNRTSRS